ncbi:hypothetical protein ACWOA0_02525 [Ignavigranum ruoffiae]
MNKQSAKRKYLILGLLLTLLAVPQVSAEIIKRPDIQVDPKSGLVIDAPYSPADYAPFLWYDHYDYQGTGNEFATYQVQRIFELNQENRYQYRQISGSLIDFVMEIGSEGVVELANFNDETATNTDYRDHADAQDDLIKTIIPSSLEPGTEFYQSYGQDRPMVVVGILQQVEVLDQMYYDVLLIESAEESEPVMRYYYAPKIGLIQVEMEDGDLLIQSQLAAYQ